jgi:hypothetical protein
LSPHVDDTAIAEARERGKPHIGSDFEEFLTEEGILDEVTATAEQRVREWQEAPPVDLHAILPAWAAFASVLGFTSVRTEQDYERAMRVINTILDEVGDDETHPLAEPLDWIATQVHAYEAKHFPMDGDKENP